MMKDRLNELLAMIQMNDSLEDVQIIIPVIRNRRRRIESEFLGNSRNDIFDDTNVAAINQSASVENLEAAEIRENINLIAQNTEGIKKLHSKILSNFNRHHKEKEELDEVTIKIKNSINIVLEKIKLLENDILENVYGISEAELKLCKNQSAILSRKFYEVMKNFNEAERIYHENLINQNQQSNSASSYFAIETGTSMCITDTTFMKQFFTEIEYSKYILQNLIVECVEKIKILHSVVLSNPKNDPNATKQIEEVTTEIIHLATTVMEKLLLIDQSIRNGVGISETKIRICKSHYHVILNLFVEIIIGYNNLHLDFHERCKYRIQRQLDIAGKGASNEELEEMVENGSPGIFTHGIITETQQASQILQMNVRNPCSGYKCRNDMEKDLMYLKLVIFCINSQMSKNDKGLEQWISNIHCIQKANINLHYHSMMKDRLLELQEMIQMNDSLEDIQENIPVTKNTRKRRTILEFLSFFKIHSKDAKSKVAINQSILVEDVAAEIRENINFITENTEKLRNLHAKVLSNSRYMIENSILENIDGISEAELKLRKNKCAILSRKFDEVMKNFNEAKRMCQENLNSRIQYRMNTEKSNHVPEAEKIMCITNESFLNEFFIEVDYIRDILQNSIVECIEKIKRLHSRILGNPVNDPIAKKELDEVTLEIEKLAKAVMEKLILIEQSIKNDDGTSQTQLKIRKYHFEVMSNLFIDIIRDYNNSQTEFHERCKQRIRRQLDISGNGVPGRELEDMIENGNPGIFQHGIITINQISQTKDGKPYSADKCRNDMEKDLLYFMNNHQISKPDKSLEQWVKES